MVTAKKDPYMMMYVLVANNLEGFHGSGPTGSVQTAWYNDLMMKQNSPLKVYNTNFTCGLI